MDRLSVKVSVPADQLPAGAAEGLPAQAPAIGGAAAERMWPMRSLARWRSSVHRWMRTTARSRWVLMFPPPRGCGLGWRCGCGSSPRNIKDCLAVPGEAVVADENGDSVIALIEGSRRRIRRSNPDCEENGLIEVITDDLKEGDTVVTAGGSACRRRRR